MPTKKNLLGQSAISLSMKVGNQILSFVLMVLLARIMGVNDFGTYLFVWSWVQLLVILSVCGMDMGALRYLGTYAAEKKYKSFDTYKIFGLRIIFTSALLISLCGLFVLEILPDFEPNLYYCFLIGFAVLPFMALIKFYQSILRVWGRVIAGQFSENIIRPGLQIILVILVVAIFQTIGALSAMITLLISTVIACVYTLIMERKEKHPEDTENQTDLMPKGEWLHYGLTMIFITGSAVVLKQTGVIMLGILDGLEESGLFGAASRISYLTTFALTSVNMIIAPRIAGLYTKNNHAALQTLLNEAAIIIAAFTFVVVFILGMGTEFLMGLFGEDFTGASTALRILLISQMIGALTGPVGYLMAMTGHHKQAAYIFFGAAILNIILNFILIPIYGVTGAAIASGLAMVFWNILSVIFVIKNLKLNPSIFTFFNKNKAL
jgi:O-antigen/teichoic acid export membrane protein